MMEQLLTGDSFRKGTEQIKLQCIFGCVIFCVLVGYDTCISVSLSQNSLLYIFFCACLNSNFVKELCYLHCSRYAFLVHACHLLKLLVLSEVC